MHGEALSEKNTSTRNANAGACSVSFPSSGSQWESVAENAKFTAVEQNISTAYKASTDSFWWNSSFAFTMKFNQTFCPHLHGGIFPCDEDLAFTVSLFVEAQSPVEVSFSLLPSRLILQSCNMYAHT